MIVAINKEVEVAIQLAHDLDETGMPCVCIDVGLLGFWQLFASFGLKHYADFAHQKKVCKVCMPDFCRLAHSGKVCIVRQMHTFEIKCALSMHLICTKCV
jgi:hypothetical protein